MNKGFQLTALVLLVSFSVPVAGPASNADTLEHGIADGINPSAPKISLDDSSTSESIKRSWRANPTAVGEESNTRKSGKFFVDRLPDGDESIPLKEDQENSTVVRHTDERYQPFIIETNELDLEQRVKALESEIAPAKSISDRVLCKTALSNDGFQWESDTEFNSVIAEAQERNLSIRRCRAILMLDTEVITEADIEAKRISPTRVISLSRKASNEAISITYLKDRKYIPSAMRKISYLLRDLKTGKVGDVSAKAIDLLWELHADLHSKQPIEILGGYIDSSEPNASASPDYDLGGHGTGRAVDFYFPDVPASIVEKSAIVRQVGGAYLGTVDRKVFIHIDTYPENVDFQKVKEYEGEYLKSIGARSSKNGISEVLIAEEDPTAATLPSQDEDATKEVSKLTSNKDRQQSKGGSETTSSLGCLSFGGQAFDCVPIVGKSGLGTRKAVIRVRATLKDAIEACAEVFSKETPQVDIQKCGEENFSEQRRLKTSVFADCNKKTWTDLHGMSFAFVGNKSRAANTDEKYIVIRRDSRESLTGTLYFIALGVFVQLCPSTLPKKWW